MIDSPQDPEEAWHRKAIEAREKLATLDDAALLEAIRRRHIDLSQGLWEVVRERQLGVRAVREIMFLLMEIPEAPSDRFLYYYHAASALLDLMQYPSERHANGDFNATAAELASDFYGEDVRQARLREFWPRLASHCLTMGVDPGPEPDWPTRFPRYRSEESLRLRNTDGPLLDRELIHEAWLGLHREKQGIFGIPEDGDPVQFITRIEPGREIEQVKLRYKISDLEVDGDILERTIPGGHWRFPERVTLRYGSNGAGLGAHSIQTSHASALYPWSYRPDF